MTAHSPSLGYPIACQPVLRPQHTLLLLQPATRSQICMVAVEDRHVCWAQHRVLAARGGQVPGTHTSGISGRGLAGCTHLNSPGIVGEA